MTPNLTNENLRLLGESISQNGGSFSEEAKLIPHYEDEASIAEEGNLNFFQKLSVLVRKHDKSGEKIQIPASSWGKGFSWRKLWAFTGPGWLISIAYIDPGNFATDISAGGQFNYRMIWVLVFATLLGLLLQVLAARLGLVTGLHLAEWCRKEYGDRSFITISLWLITESAIIAADIPEIIGTAFALNLLVGLKLWIGVLITGIDTMFFLGLQYYGIRVLEIFIGVLVAIISVCFFVELGLSPIDWVDQSFICNRHDWCEHFPAGQSCPPDYCGSFFLGFVPTMDANGLFIAVSLLGSVVMVHNLCKFYFLICFLF